MAGERKVVFPEVRDRKQRLNQGEMGLERQQERVIIVILQKRPPIQSLMCHFDIPETPSEAWIQASRHLPHVELGRVVGGLQNLRFRLGRALILSSLSRKCTFASFRL